MKPEDVKDRSFTVYQPGIKEDSILAYWYMTLINTNELHTTFGAQGLASFFRLFQPPNRLIYIVDPLKQDGKLDGCFWFAVWFEPVFDGAFMGLWVDKSKRQSRLSLFAGERALDYGLSRWPILLGVTKQQKLIDPHLRMGYTLLGKLPRFWDREDVWVLYITQETFDNRECRIYLRSSSGNICEEVKNTSAD